MYKIYIYKIFPVGMRSTSAKELLFGASAVLGALRANKRKFRTLYVQGNSENTRVHEIGNLAMEEFPELVIKPCSRNQLHRLLSQGDSNAQQRPHNGVVLETLALEIPTLASIPRARRGLWVALDRVVDPQNLGNVLRTCYFLGVAGVVLCKKYSAPLSPVVAKAASGALDLVNLHYCTSLPKFLDESRETASVIGLHSAPGLSTPLHELGVPPHSKPTVLVLGSEGNGLRRPVVEACSAIVHIPGTHVTDCVDSLNVSVAAGIAVHAFQCAINVNQYKHV